MTQPTRHRNKLRRWSKNTNKAFAFLALVAVLGIFELFLSIQTSSSSSLLLLNGPPPLTTTEKPSVEGSLNSTNHQIIDGGAENGKVRQQQPLWKPRVVVTGLILSDASTVVAADTPEPNVRQVELLSSENDSNETTTAGPSILPFEERFYKECVPMVDWHTQSFPTCNIMHEIDVGNDDNVTLLSMQGSWRSVWKLQHAASNETVVLKLLQIRRRFDHESYHQHRVDALAMERLTSSRFIVNVYGFCGQSVISEYASGDARGYIKSLEKSMDRLRVGRDLARAVADMHSIDYPSATNVTFVHNDMNIANAVNVNGVIKLNDFNLGVLQRWNTTTNRTICNAPVRFASPLWKSPEENRNTSYVDAAATDVYGLGNLLFHVLTRRQPWTHLEPGGPLTPLQAAERKMAGGQPYYPPKYSNETNEKALRALYYAVTSCFRTNPIDRPSSFQIAQLLDTAIQKIKDLPDDD